MTQRETIEVCAACGCADIRQEISFMVNPNTYDGSVLDMNDAQWEDFYHCPDCAGECQVETRPAS